ncbi:MAG: tRNA dihydrouridine synthase DusB, partial [Actinomycetaceae bacterium UMB1218B]|nr:tRNA dihydrouridine synthase DusB [Actinomycetaceae bacterium UMB1218B]
MIPSESTLGPTLALEVGPLRVWSPIVLAPMAGVTDVPFRRLCRQMGEEGLPDWLNPSSSNAQVTPEKGVDALAGLYVCEMVTSRALVEGNVRTLEMVRPDPAERVRSIQLYGVDPATMAQATSILIDRDLVDHIDLNFGCPVPKVTKKGGGAALPWKRDLFDDLVHAVVGAADRAGAAAGRDIPVTVKMRVGIDDDHITFLDAAKVAENRGVAAVALHARTQTQHYAGHADWTQIKRLKDAMRIPVFGNGDIFSGADAQRMMDETGCDAVVVGRGCQGRPWLFTDLTSTLMGGPAFS